MGTLEYQGKRVCVTGAGSGIGRGIALMFAGEGASVACCDVNRQGAEETVRMIGEAGAGQGIPCIFDVSDEAQVIQNIAAMQGLDILVNAAGIIQLGKIEDITSEQWDRVLDINLKGTFLCCKAAVPIMKQQRRGTIINVTAAAAKTGGMNVGCNYVCSKAGITALTIHLAKQLAPFGIRVNALSPGPIDTPMLHTDDYDDEKRKNIAGATPLGMGYPDDIAHGALFLASSLRARYITGEILDVDGGLFMD